MMLYVLHERLEVYFRDGALDTLSARPGVLPRGRESRTQTKLSAISHQLSETTRHTHMRAVVDPERSRGVVRSVGGQRATWEAGYNRRVIGHWLECQILQP